MNRDGRTHTQITCWTGKLSVRTQSRQVFFCSIILNKKRRASTDEGKSGKSDLFLLNFSHHIHPDSQTDRQLRRSLSTALTAGVWPPRWSQYRRLKQENDMFQSNLGYMWPRVSRNDHGLGRWLSRKRCPQPTLMTSVWPLGPMKWQEKWTAAICPLTSSLHHVHPHHHHHPNSGKRVCAIFKDGIDPVTGITQPWHCSSFTEGCWSITDWEN